ncbi:PREDICTED: ALBINO3-like protein 2, chloroplastic isoform X2 [Ipomoea nil]|uniref:ALBINO3-like protein 2, chloroplastic isoform X2 n=1 Tax=Ipomoea nil TaxID=35883 RepID=UPI000901F636|nr:PREDICTED: ALBINO3-like protein 2, chloroplastic isoform X2 [Ipomoea nil]
MRNFLQRKLLRRSPSLSAWYYSSYSFAQSYDSDQWRRHHHHLIHPLSPSRPVLSSLASTQQFLVPFCVCSFSRSFSTRESASIEGVPCQDNDFTDSQSATPSDLFLGGDVVGGGSVEEPILPVRVLISLLDGYHDLTGFPWWAVIASGTLAMRLALLPFTVLQLHKLKRIGELLPKLPRPFPPPMSGRTFKDQFQHFRREKSAAGCPSLLWFIASFAVQVPCFLLWLTTIRRMSLDHHDGFDWGGTLWFQNLTEVPNGTLGPIFPLLIAGLHFVNVQVSFQKMFTRTGDTFDSLAKYYKLYLEILTLPILFISFNLPQQISLKHPYIRKKLELPDRDTSVFVAKQKELDSSEEVEINTSRESRKIAAQNLSAKELVNVSIKFLAKGQKDMALRLLRLALDKEPDHARALILLGQTQLQNGFLSEATENFECCISKLLLNGHPTEVEDVDNLILSSAWAGVACIRQGKYDEGIVHLERVAVMKEPEDPKTKAHYYEALILFSSALYNVGRKAEAAKYLRIVVAYDPSYRELLEQCENDDNT